MNKINLVNQGIFNKANNEIKQYTAQIKNNFSELGGNLNNVEAKLNNAFAKGDYEGIASLKPQYDNLIRKWTAVNQFMQNKLSLIMELIRSLRIR